MDATKHSTLVGSVHKMIQMAADKHISDIMECESYQELQITVAVGIRVMLDMLNENDAYERTICCLVAQMMYEPALVFLDGEPRSFLAMRKQMADQVQAMADHMKGIDLSGESTMKHLQDIEESGGSRDALLKAIREAKEEAKDATG